MVKFIFIIKSLWSIDKDKVLWLSCATTIKTSMQNNFLNLAISWSYELPKHMVSEYFLKVTDWKYSNLGKTDIAKTYLLWIFEWIWNHNSSKRKFIFNIVSQ